MAETHPDDTEREARHRERMARKKAVIDARIAAADQDRGVLVVLTGNGKGKSSSAFGMVARALGHGMQAGVVQFIKGRTDTGEEAFFARQPGVTWHVMGDGFTWETQDRAQDIAKAQAAWTRAKALLGDTSISLVVLDELTYCFKYGYLDLHTVLDDLEHRPPMQHVVITGRGAPAELVEFADTVTDMGATRHAFSAGVRAQQGLEF